MTTLNRMSLSLLGFIVLTTNFHITGTQKPFSNYSSSDVNVVTNGKCNLPLDSDDWKSTRIRGAVYVDKTMFLLNLRDDSSQLYIFTRPRGSGKTFFLSIIESYFRGDKHLFVGTGIFKFGNCENNTWIKYPVIRLNFNLNISHLDGFGVSKYLKENMDVQIRDYFLNNNLDESILTENEYWFPGILDYLHRKFNSEVVILIDDYDRLSNHAFYSLENEKLSHNIAHFFDWLFLQIKACSADDIKLAWITGVNQFAPKYLDSGANSFVDISYNAEYATVAGFTKEEISYYFKFHIADFALTLRTTTDEIMAKMAYWYEGYNYDVGNRKINLNHARKIYNPTSVLSSLRKRRIQAYWSETEAIKFILQRTFSFSWDTLHTVRLDSSDISCNKYPINEIPIWVRLLNNGYLTIGDCDRLSFSITCTLTFPNNEVKLYLMEKVKNYIPSSDTSEWRT